MMLKIDCILENIQTISVNDIRVLIVTKGGVITKDGKNIFQGQDSCFANNFANKEWFNYGDKSNKFLFKNDQRVVLIYNYAPKTISSKGVVIIKNQTVTNTIVQDFYYYDFNSDKEILLYEKVTGGFVLNYQENRKAIFQSLNVLKLVSFDSGETLWSIDLSNRKIQVNKEFKDARILQIIGVFANQLLVWMEGNILVAIDTERGVVIYELKPMEGLKDGYGTVFRDFGGICLDADKAKLYWFGPLHYLSFDLKSRTLQVLYTFYTGDAFGYTRIEAIPEGKRPKDLTVKHCVYTDDYIYYIGGYTMASNVVGVFDRKACVVAWQEELDLWTTDPYNSLKEIQYGAGKIYVLDTSGTLRVFEEGNALSGTENNENTDVLTSYRAHLIGYDEYSEFLPEAPKDGFVIDTEGTLIETVCLTLATLDALLAPSFPVKLKSYKDDFEDITLLVSLSSTDFSLVLKRYDDVVHVLVDIFNEQLQGMGASSQIIIDEDFSDEEHVFLRKL